MQRDAGDSGAAGSVPNDEPAIEAVAGAILEAVPRSMRALREQMRAGRPSGVSVSQFRVLLFVRRHPGTSLSAVAEHIGVSLPAASQLVGRLVTAGYVERTENPRERRRVDLRLTEGGAAVLSQHDVRTRNWLRAELRKLDASRLARLEGALEDLEAVLNSPRDAAG